MKKTTITIATLSLILTLIATAVGQDRRRAPQPKGMNKADLTEQLSIQSNRQRGRRPNAVGNPFGLGGTVTAGVKNRQAANLGDTATHEVGHKGNRRNVQAHPIPSGDGTTNHFRTNRIKRVKGQTEYVDNDEYRTKRPNRRKR
jgi:hypothetical protein